MRAILAGIAALGAASVAFDGVGRQLSPRPDRWLTIGGRKIGITDCGSGPAILFLHGLGGQAGNFHLLTPHLAGFRCIIPDRPGSGWSDPAAPGQSGIDGHATTAAAIIEALDIAPALVVGHSLGGAIGLRLVHDRPDLVAGLVGVGALTGPQMAEFARIGAALGSQTALRETMVRTVGVPLAPALISAFIAASFAPEPMPPGFLVPGGLLAGLSPRMAGAVIRDLEVVAHGAETLHADLPGITRPVLLVHGTEDQVLAAEDHATPAAALIAGAELWLPAGGHMLPATQPALVAAAIRHIADRAGTGADRA